MKVLVIGDVHIPFVHANYLKFCKDRRDSLNPDVVVFIGDIVDNHALSRFKSDPDLMSPGDEWAITLRELKRWYNAFPEAVWVKGNHDSRPFNKAFDAGIPSAMMKPLKEIYQAPTKWTVVDEIVIDNVLYTHGLNCGGVSTWQNASKNYGMSTVMGHLHSVAGVRYWQRVNDQIFTLATGCGVDQEALAFAYGKTSPSKPVLALGEVIDGVEARSVIMNLGDRKYRRKRRQL